MGAMAPRHCQVVLPVDLVGSSRPEHGQECAAALKWYGAAAFLAVDPRRLDDKLRPRHLLPYPHWVDLSVNGPHLARDGRFLWRHRDTANPYCCMLA